VSVPFKNGDPCDDRSRRPCPQCGGTLYDWGVGPASGWWRRDGEPRYWAMHWYCYRGCEFSATEILTYARLYLYRTHFGNRHAPDPDRRFKRNGEFVCAASVASTNA
jgi:hypothetical protein